MINNNEISAVELSPTKRDFYQIWNELIDTASKLSNRWDPSSTNESDPGIVLLKVLTAIADKLNYTIDKNTLEAFMPSATQEESMRKLCDMLGYTMKYYRSATCPIQISYIGTDYDLSADNCRIVIPKFTNIKNEDEDINYVTLSPIVLGDTVSYDTAEAIEGEYVQYDNITRDQLDDNHRYYLPESQTAENGIFLVAADDETIEYEKVSNLNAQKLGTYCWKFGYDSREDMPYIEFPADIDSLIGEGISFGYVRTNGANGNISAGLLNKINASSCELIISGDTQNPITCDDSWFSVINTSAATNGDDKETIDAAYNSYKKTIGTFDTLVSCRDYMNKIYQLTEGDIDGSSSTTPLVSNIIASDIRDDINRGVTVCSFSENGLTYTNQRNASLDEKTEFDNFDILLYPFKRVAGTNTESEYKNSFTYSDENLSEIKAGIDKNKTISHHILSPKSDEIACVKDLIKVKAKITTTTKVNSVAEASILNKVFTALYKNFNMRKIDFGEEITDEMIEKVILNADSRIKNINLSTEHSLNFDEVNGTSEKNTSKKTAEEGYGRTFINLALLNVLAGRIPLFNYDESFEPALNESKAAEYDDVFYPIDASKPENAVTKIEASYEPPVSDNIVLSDNEVIQFRSPSFKTTVTYPSYVNYFIKLNENITIESIAAKFMTLKDFMNKLTGTTQNIDSFLTFIADKTPSFIAKKAGSGDDETFETAQASYLWIFKLEENKYTRITTEDVFNQIKEAGGTYYYLPMSSTYATNFALVYSFLTTSAIWYGDKHFENVYKSMGMNTTYSPGYLIDSNHYKYAETTAIPSTSSAAEVDTKCAAWEAIYIPDSSSDDETHGLGRNAALSGIKESQEYKLGTGEYLLINYTSTSTSDSGNESSTVVNKIYKTGTIIRPSFELTDSSNVHSQKSTSWSKKTGFNFSDENVENPDGMFTLSANQQIEIIEPVIVKLGPDADSTTNSTLVNIYWVRNDDALKIKSAQKTLTFTWDDDNTYTLKENEYFFYTNKNKTDLAYYGNGTKIVRTESTLELVRNISAEQSISADEILQYGLAASIPWISKQLTKESNIELHEYQYVNVIKGQVVTDITCKEATDKLTENWIPITSAKYASATASGDPSDDETELQEIKIDSMTWEARSLLQVNMGPKLTQTLHTNDKIVAYSTENVVDYGDGYEFDWTKEEKWEPIKEFTNISLKSNVVLQSAAKENLISPNVFCQLKAIKIEEESTQKLAGISIDFGNFGDGLTSVALDADNNQKNSFPIFTCIPTTHFGLIMFYVSKVEGTPGVTLTADAGDIGWCNSDDSSASEISLNEGINVIRIPADCSKITVAATSGKLGLIFSNLDIIPNNNPLNPKLGWAAQDETNALLKKLKDYKDFYYNAIIDSGLAIRFNDADDYDTLDYPEAWYDYNNVCNKFLIAELNADDFKTSIIIDKASKVK